MVEFGNQYWKQRKHHGPKSRFKTPEDMKNACLKYFESAKAITHSEKLEFNNGNFIYTLEVSRKQPMRLTDLQSELKISHSSWSRWKKTRKDLKPVMDWAEQVIFEYNLAGVKSLDFPVRILNSKFYTSKLLKHAQADITKRRNPTAQTHLDASKLTLQAV